MTSLPGAPDLSRRWTLAAVLQGPGLVAPVLPSVFIFAATFGTVAAQKGLTLAEAGMMSALVYAGASQLVSLQAWPEHFTPAAVLAIAVVTATVNLRLLLMSAALRPVLGPLPPWQSYPLLFLTTDSTWIAIMRRGGNAFMPPLFLGAGFTMWLVWVGGTIPGYLLGALVPEAQRYGLDLVFPAFFASMLVPLWRGARRAIPWAVAGAVAIAVNLLVPGWWFIVAGALAGSLTGAAIHERK